MNFNRISSWPKPFAYFMGCIWKMDCATLNLPDSLTPSTARLGQVVTGCLFKRKSNCVEKGELNWSWFWLPIDLCCIAFLFKIIPFSCGADRGPGDMAARELPGVAGNSTLGRMMTIKKIIYFFVSQLASLWWIIYLRNTDCGGSPE